MDKTIKLLGGLLAVQLLLALWAFTGGTDLSAQRPDEPLLAFEPGEVTQILIEGENGAAVTLNRTDDGWVLPEAWNVPARQGKVERLLSLLQDLKKGLAVATSAGARERFEVSEKTFRRRITLSLGNDNLGAFYLGTSPGMRKIHARAADDEAVYSVVFSAFEAPSTVEDWLDSALVRVKESDIQSVELDGLTVTRVADGEEPAGEAAAPTVWQAAGLAEGEQLNQAGARELIGAFDRVDVRRVLGTEGKAEFNQDQPETRLTLALKGGESVGWVLSRPQTGDNPVLKSSAHPWYFEVAERSVQRLMESARRDALALTAQSADDTEAESGPAPEAKGAD